MTNEAVTENDTWKAYDFKEVDDPLDVKGVFWGRNIQEAIDLFMEENTDLCMVEGGVWVISEDRTRAALTYKAEGCNPDDPEDFYTAARVLMKPDDYTARGSVRLIEDSMDAKYTPHELSSSCGKCNEAVAVNPPKRIRDLMDAQDDRAEDAIERFLDTKWFHCPNCQKIYGEQAVE